MTNSEAMRERLAWLFAIVGGACLAVKVARIVTERAGGGNEPVVEMVQDVLAEHREDDTVMVHAFEEAVESADAGAAA